MTVGSGRPHELLVLREPVAVGRAAALVLVREAHAAIARRGLCVVAVSGGETPEPMFSALPRAGREVGLDWRRVALVWVDERRVPYSSAHSNHGSALRAGLRRLAGAAFLPMPVSGEPDADARAYERTIRELKQADCGAGFQPADCGAGFQPALSSSSERRRQNPRVPKPFRLDIAVLGLGADGHVASLFPESPALAVRHRLVVPAAAPSGVRDRLTLTLPPLRSARLRLLLVTGVAKRAIVARALAGPGAGSPLPIDLLLAARGRTIWLVDEAAAGVVVG